MVFVPDRKIGGTIKKIKKEKEMKRKRNGKKIFTKIKW